MLHMLKVRILKPYHTLLMRKVIQQQPLEKLLTQRVSIHKLKVRPLTLKDTTPLPLKPTRMQKVEVQKLQASLHMLRAELKIILAVPLRLRI
jgi:hypothetical protein